MNRIQNICQVCGVLWEAGSGGDETLMMCGDCLTHINGIRYQYSHAIEKAEDNFDKDQLRYQMEIEISQFCAKRNPTQPRWIPPED